MFVVFILFLNEISCSGLIQIHCSHISFVSSLQYSPPYQRRHIQSSIYPYINLLIVIIHIKLIYSKTTHYYLKHFYFNFKTFSGISNFNLILRLLAVLYIFLFLIKNKINYRRYAKFNSCILTK